MKHAAWIILYSALLPLQAGQIELGLRLQVNSYRYFFNPALNQINTQTAFVPGLSLQVKTSPSTFIRLGVLPQKRNYGLHYTVAPATMIGAQLQLTETEVSFGKYLFSKGKNQSLYLNAGLQLLARNWGEEVYQEAIIANTYWPSSRLSSSVGMGYSFCPSERMKINLGLGANTFLSEPMAFDTSTHQTFFYLIFSGITSFKSVNPIHKKCPNQF